MYKNVTKIIPLICVKICVCFSFSCWAGENNLQTYMFDSKKFREECRQWHSKKSEQNFNNVELSEQEKLALQQQIRLIHTNRMAMRKCKKIQQMSDHQWQEFLSHLTDTEKVSLKNQNYALRQKLTAADWQEIRNKCKNEPLLEKNKNN